MVAARALELVSHHDLGDTRSVSDAETERAVTDDDMKWCLTTPAFFGKVISHKFVLSLPEAPGTTRDTFHPSRSRESADIVSRMIWKVSHDTSGGTQFRSVPETLDRLDRSDESRPVLILSTAIRFADLSSAAKVIASLVMILRRVEFYSVLLLFVSSFWQSSAQTPQGTQFLDLFNCQSSAKFLLC
jgi:hypothetical protein